MNDYFLIAGAGKHEIPIPKAYLAAENFCDIHDSLYARAVVIQEEQTWVLVVLDVTSLPAEVIAAIRQRVASDLSVSLSAVWVCVTHTFSTPHVLPEDAFQQEPLRQARNAYRNGLINAACQAAGEAYEHREKAVLSFGRGYCDVNVNRDAETKDGWWLGTNHDRPSDKAVSVLCLNGEDGHSIAVLYHYACQSSVLDQSVLTAGGKAVSTDMAGQASQYVESTLGTTALFLIGSAGDQAPCQKAVNETFENGQRITHDIHEAGFAICEKLGRQLGQAVFETVKAAEVCHDVCVHLDQMKVTVPGKQMNRNLRELHPVKSGVYIPAEDKTVEVESVRLGDIALLGVKPELNVCTASALTNQSAFAHTLIVTMVNGGAKYMADAASYDLFTYEAMNSPFGKGAAEILTDQAVKLLKRLKVKS